jgi:DNA polymerase-1
MNRLVLVDGNAILHRAFHALPPLTDPEGNVVNAVYGFASMLFKIFKDLKPTHVAVAFDRPAPTFRKEMFAQYQAHRPKMDDDLVPQVGKVHEMLLAMGIPVYEKDGFEADDVIGTIVNKTVSGNIDQTIVVTGDRDILQLVEEGKVFVYMPTKGLSEAKLYGEKETIERMGVKPEQIPDLKALAGDQSDNYSGVDGIGPKTAVNLLTEFGSIDKLYERGDKGDWGNAGDKVIEKLKAGKENALLSHQLATIKRDVPVDVDLQPVKSLNTSEARRIFGDLGFKSLIKRMENQDEGKSETGKRKTDKKIKTDPADNGQLTLV